jgi:hypothetical protein
MSKFSGVIETTCNLFGIYEFFPADWMTNTAFKVICGTVPSLCELGAFLIVDEDPLYNDSERQ